MRPISIYIHIPFCKAKCYYCDFASKPSMEDYYDEYVGVLLKEIEQWGASLQEYRVQSIFIGGGTPTVLAPHHIFRIMNQLHDSFTMDKDVEITIESNPGTLDKNMLRVLRKSNINRLSMGLQAWQDYLLKKLGRIHTLQEFLSNYYDAREVGFDNINIDLMFALPNQTLQEWEDTLINVLQLAPTHISTYSLIIEEDTPFFSWSKQNRLTLPDEELDRRMYHTAIDLLRDGGYKHYEISNFAKSSKECYHNTVYWRCEEYLGLGLGAHSYFNNRRFHNTYSLKDYMTFQGDISAMEQDIQYIEDKSLMEEFMFLGLRMIDGISIGAFANKFNRPIEEVYGEQLNKLIQLKLLKIEENHVRLTLKGLDLSNRVFEAFLIE